jgi:LacI family transcriptional regulator
MANHFCIVVSLLDLEWSSDDLLNGVFQFVRDRKCAHVHVSSGLLGDCSCAEIPAPLGILAKIDSRDVWKRLQEFNCPVINVNGSLECDFPCVMIDEMAVGQLAADHLIEQGFRELACLTETKRKHVDRRATSFSTACNLGRGRRLSIEQNCEAGINVMAPAVQQCEHWLEQLPRPIGVFAASDGLARVLLQASRNLGVAVPDELGIVTVDDCGFVSENMWPPLTAIVPPLQRVGYEAAHLLAEMVSFGTTVDSCYLVPPTEIHLRRSTDILAIADEDVAAAVRFIREKCCRQINVGDVVEAVSISRRALEQRFSALLGHSPKEEIRRARIRVAKRFLQDLHLSISDVAVRAGFGSPALLSTQFKQYVGVSPIEFRKRHVRTKPKLNAIRNSAIGKGT